MTNAPVSSARQRCHTPFREKRHDVLDHVISRKNEHRRRMIARRHPTRSREQRRCRVAFRRFSHNILFRKITEQTPAQRLLVRHSSESRCVPAASVRCRRLTVSSSSVLSETRRSNCFGRVRRLKRPETLAASSRQDQRIDGIGHCWFASRNGKWTQRDFPVSFSETRRIRVCDVLPDIHSKKAEQLPLAMVCSPSRARPLAWASACWLRTK